VQRLEWSGRRSDEHNFSPVRAPARAGFFVSSRPPADACAGAGFHEKGLEVALDIEQLLYEATTLLNAASLINRIADKAKRSAPLGPTEKQAIAPSGNAIRTDRMETIGCCQKSNYLAQI